MNYKVKLSVFLRKVVFFIVPFIFHGLNGETIHFDGNEFLIGDKISYYMDTLGEINSPTELDIGAFVDLTGEIPNLGVTDASHWLKLKVKNNTDVSNLILEIAYPPLDEVILFSNKGEGQYKRKVLGELYPYSNKDYDDPNYIFNLNVGMGETSTFFIKIKSAEQVILPMRIGSTKSVIDSNGNKDIIMGVYAGIMFVMFLYNFFIYFTVRDKSYLYYVFYIGFIALAQLTLQGYTFKYFWPNTPWISTRAIFYFSSLSGIALVAFINRFLELKHKLRRFQKVGYVIMILYCIDVVTATGGFLHLSTHILDVSALLIIIYALFSGIYLSIKGDRSAKFFLMAWSMFILGVIAFVLRNSGILEMNDVTNYTISAGTAVETILLSLALADRINVLKKDKAQSQKRELEALQENERLVLEQNVILEQKVEERTEELRESNKDLNVALDTLRSAQSQLVDAEKMASLGQLTAGIAHEINNPINFVTSNIKPLQRDIEDMLSLVEKYNEIDTDVDLVSKLAEIHDFKEDLDVEYVIEEMDSLLKGIDEGAQRTAEIVRGLKNFSRLDEAELKDANINEGLLSTLTVLNSNVSRSEVELVKELGDLPVIECYPGKLNQVFMNIITNGIQAVNDNSSEKGKKMLVKSDFEDENIVIRIKDNGPGIPDDVRAKIFEPFFTTKDVGEGTGLGLSIVHSIIESHKGEIVLESELGVGTEFIIKLPVKK